MKTFQIADHKTRWRINIFRPDEGWKVCLMAVKNANTNNSDRGICLTQTHLIEKDNKLGQLRTDGP